jgi:hypothetical protein
VNTDRSTDGTTDGTTVVVVVVVATVLNVCWESVAGVVTAGTDSVVDGSSMRVVASGPGEPDPRSDDPQATVGASRASRASNHVRMDRVHHMSTTRQRSICTVGGQTNVTKVIAAAVRRPT